MNLSDLDATGVSVQYERRGLLATRCYVGLLDGEMNHRESDMRGRQTGAGWRMEMRAPNGFELPLEIRGKPKRKKHGQTLVLNDSEATLAEITDPANANSGPSNPMIRLESRNLRVDFTNDEHAGSSEISLIARSQDEEIGRYWLHDASASSLSFAGKTDLDVRVAAAVCLDLHVFFVSASDR